MKVLTLTIFAACIYSTWAQYGPAPPRLEIPGAIALGPKPGNFRQGRIIQPPSIPASPIRIKRPGQIRAGAFKSVPSPAPYLQTIDEPQKPVTEEPEDDERPSTIQPFLSTLASFTPQVTQDDAPQFFPSPSPPKPVVFNNAIAAPQPIPVRYAEPSKPPQPIRPLIPNAAPAQVKSEPPVRPQPVRVAQLSYRPPRPQFRPESRPQIDDDEDEQPIRQVYRPQPTRPQAPQPIRQQPQQQQQSSGPREKKPVAQVIRKYRDDNPDGSITWGFENDDGSFKEETIGIDCITRGRYGYVDPDGLKREYNYETGIACDKEKEQQEEQGFIDYQENKAVLPNGVVLDLAAMAKKSKRPIGNQKYRN